MYIYIHTFLISNIYKYKWKNAKRIIKKSLRYITISSNEIPYQKQRRIMLRNAIGKIEKDIDKIHHILENQYFGIPSQK